MGSGETEDKKIQDLEVKQYMIKRQGQRYFKEKLHLMYNKKTLLFKNRGEGQTSIEYTFTGELIKEEIRLKNQINEKILDDYDFTVMIDRLKDHFERVSDKPMRGGGGLNQLKDTIRRKINQIVPR